MRSSPPNALSTRHEFTGRVAGIFTDTMLEPLVALVPPIVRETYASASV